MGHKRVFKLDGVFEGSEYLRVYDSNGDYSHLRDRDPHHYIDEIVFSKQPNGLYRFRLPEQQTIIDGEISEPRKVHVIEDIAHELPSYRTWDLKWANETWESLDWAGQYWSNLYSPGSGMKSGSDEVRIQSTTKFKTIHLWVRYRGKRYVKGGWEFIAPIFFTIILDEKSQLFLQQLAKDAYKAHLEAVAEEVFNESNWY